MGMLDERVAFITGGASGIGEATAKRFANEGARIALADLNEIELQRVRGEIEGAGGQATAITCNVADSDDVRRALATAATVWGRLDIVFSNAGIGGTWAPIEDLRPDEWDRTIETNLRSTYLVLHHAIPHMKERGGSVIVTSSVSGNRTFAQPGAAAYSTSKAAQVALVKMAAIEFGRYDVRVNAVCPGGVHTNIQGSLDSRNTETIPVPPLDTKKVPTPALHDGVAEPPDIADVCLFLASDLSRHVSGVEIYVDGGQSLLR